MLQFFKDVFDALSGKWAKEDRELEARLMSAIDKKRAALAEYDVLVGRRDTAQSVLDRDSVIRSNLAGVFSLSNLLKSKGWKVLEYKSRSVVFCKRMQSMYSGYVQYFVYIYTDSGGKLVLCRLVGPVINGRTGTITPNASLGEWKTPDGAIKAVNFIFDDEWQSYQIKERNFRKRRINFY